MPSKRIEKAATGELANALRFGGVVASGWYELSLYRSLWHLLSDQLKLDDAGIRLLTQKATALSINTIYRTLAKITTPSMLISFGAKVFNNFYDNAHFEVRTSRPGYIVGEWVSVCWIRQLPLETT